MSYKIEAGDFSKNLVRILSCYRKLSSVKCYTVFTAWTLETGGQTLDRCLECPGTYVFLIVVLTYLFPYIPEFSADWSHGMSVDTRSRISFLPVFCPKIQRLKYTHLYFFPLVLYGCETWSLTLKDAYRLRVFENRVLWKIFRPKILICNHHAVRLAWAWCVATWNDACVTHRW